MTSVFLSPTPSFYKDGAGSVVNRFTGLGRPYQWRPVRPYKSRVLGRRTEKFTRQESLRPGEGGTRVRTL